MLVLVSFVLVLAAAVTLVVGLLQSGLGLIYLSIGCSVLAGVVLAVAVLRGRPEPKSAGGRGVASPPPRAEVPASVGAPSAAETTSSWSAPASPPEAAVPAPPPPAPAPSAAQDSATKAAGSALLGRLRGRRAEQASPAAAPEPVPVPAPAAAVPAPAEVTTEMPVAARSAEDEDGFPIADYERLRATELLSKLPALDRNQLEAVRERESSGKNRFTVMSRIDSLLAAASEPAWEVGDDAWEEAGVDAESEAVVLEAEALRDEEDFGAALDAEEEEEEDAFAAGEVEDDELDELVSPAPGAGADFPIPEYDSLTVGQILPRLSALDADELADVRAREQAGRNRGTILDRVDRLATKAGTGTGARAMPMPAAPPARKAPARKTAAVAKTTAPGGAKTPRATKAPVAVEEAVTVPKRIGARKAAATKAAAVPMPSAPPAPPAPAARKAPGRKAPARKTVAPVVPEVTAAPVVKKARAPRKATKRP